MTTALRLDGPRLPPASGRPARRLVVLLHGYGADGDDLIGLAPYLGRILPDAAFVAPHGPEPCDLSPMGYQWFGLAGYDPMNVPRDPDALAARHGAMAADAARVAPLLDRFVDAELARLGIGDEALALVGFSQGTMMALQVGLRRARPCAGIVGFSGALVGAERLADEIRVRPPVLLCHGDADPMIPCEAMFLAAGGLGAAGVLVEWHLCPGVGHGIDEGGLELAGRFLSRVLGRPA